MAKRPDCFEATARAAIDAVEYQNCSVQGGSMAQKDTIRFGIIGTGMMGCEHIQNIALLPGVEVTAIADPNERSRAWGRLAVGREVEVYTNTGSSSKRRRLMRWSSPRRFRPTSPWPGRPWIGANTCSWRNP